MKCVRCSAEIPAQSQFCLRCGSPVYGTAANPSGVFTPTLAPPRSNTKPLLITLIALLVLVAVGLGAVLVRGSLVQKPAQSTPTTLVQAPGQGSPNNLVQFPAESEPNKVVQVPTETAPPPTDVIDYLAFLKKIEASKQALIRKEMGDLLTQLPEVKGLSASTDGGDYDSVFGNLSKSTNYSADEWNQLTTEFQQRTPPDSCRDLHNKYYDQLGKIQAMIVAVSDALSRVQNDPSSALHALTDMQGKASADIDTSVSAADDSLADVCHQYGLRKDFDIKGDPSSSASLFR
jgi:hypothetical protein